VLVGVTLGLVVGPVSVLGLVARAQEQPSVAAGPRERVVFVPDFGRAAEGGAALPGVEAGLRVQNAGGRATQLMAVFSATPGGEGVDCDACAVVGTACVVRPIPPGSVATLPHTELAWLLNASGTEGLTTTFRGSVVVYSVNAGPVGQHGPEWVAKAAAYGFGPEAGFGDFLCQAWGQVPADDCDSFKAFHRAYVSSDPDALWQGLPIAPVRGEPIAAVAAVPGGTMRLGDLVLDRAAAVSLAETGWMEDASAVDPVTPTLYTYDGPGAYLAAPDGMNSELVVQNGGVGCATVGVEAFRTNQGPLGDPQSLTVAAASVGLMDLGRMWPAAGSGSVRLTSDQPLAVALRTIGFGTSSTHTGLRERAGELEWAVPLAYQERRRGALELAAEQPVSAEGWESNLSVFNPVDAQRPVTMLQQAAGRPPRPPVGYPMQARTPVVFQPGFGLGLPGGWGWARFTSDPPPMPMTIESLREASDTPRFVEAWSTRAWPHARGAPPPRTIALPDLGGPAVGGDAGFTPVTTTATMTDALVGKIAVQNVATTTARIAVDGFAGCGYGGASEWSIDPFQAEVIDVSSLPAARFGANQAILRVLAGDVAVLVEIARPGERTWAEAPPDLTSAYLGEPFADPFPAPLVPTATLAVTPTEIVVELPDTTLPPVDLLTGTSDPGCFSYSASVDVSWLTVAPANGLLPGRLALQLDASLLGPGAQHIAVITIKANEPSVGGSPQRVRVVVHRSEPAGRTIFVPLAQNGEVIEP
jgi:hypothetical protein